MTYFEKILLAYLQKGRLKLEVTDFDMDAFKSSAEEEGKRRLERIEQIVFEDSDICSDAQKVEAIKLCFQKDFYAGEYQLN